MTIAGSLTANRSAEPAGNASRQRGVCDTHVHILDPDRFPFSAQRRYTPGSARVEDLIRLHDAIGIERVVVVQNSVYGSDHRCLLDALTRLGPARARGVATLSEVTTEQEIAELHDAGVRGSRLNLEVSRNRDTDSAEVLLRRAAARLPSGWLLHINASLSVIASLVDVVQTLPSPVVLDHFAHSEAALGAGQDGLAEIIDLMRSERAFVKLSAPYQISRQPGYGDILPIVRAFVEAAPGQVMWGSDWPHTSGTSRPPEQPVDFVEPFRIEDDADNLGLLAAWVPDPAVRRRILVETTAIVYGFAAVSDLD